MTFEEALRILAAFERHEVAYVLVGSMAMAAQGIVRATRDIDVFVSVDESNVSPRGDAANALSYEEGHGETAGSSRRASDQTAVQVGGRLMPVRKYRSVEEMPQAALHPPLDPRNLKLACELSAVAVRFAPRRFPPGVHRYCSVAAADEQRELWERSAAYSSR